MADTTLRLLTAARRPLISVRNAMQIVPSARAHSSSNLNDAPAWNAVPSEPASRYPPTLVRMPNAILVAFFTRQQTGVYRRGSPCSMERVEIRDARPGGRGRAIAGAAP